MGAVFANLESRDAKVSGHSSSGSRLLPFSRRGEELFDLCQRFGIESLLCASDIENVAPCAETMES